MPNNSNRKSVMAIPFWAWMTIIVVGLAIMITLPLMGR